MRIVAIACVVAAAVTVASASPADRHGKVVRVERSHGGVHRTPRVCQVQAGEGKGTCWGKAPAVGEVASVVDQQGGVLGELRVTAVNPVMDRCGKPSNWDYTFVRESGHIDKAQFGSSFGVFDVEVAPGRTRIADTGKLSPPDGKAGEQVWSALDRDGDGAGDFLVTAYTCDKSGELYTGGTAAGYCIDYWNLDHGDWRKLRHDFVETCM